MDWMCFVCAFSRSVIRLVVRIYRVFFCFLFGILWTSSANCENEEAIIYWWFTGAAGMDEIEWKTKTKPKMFVKAISNIKWFNCWIRLELSWVLDGYAVCSERKREHTHTHTSFSTSTEKRHNFWALTFVWTTGEEENMKTKWRFGMKFLICEAEHNYNNNNKIKQTKQKIFPKKFLEATMQWWLFNFSQVFRIFRECESSLGRSFFSFEVFRAKMLFE